MNVEETILTQAITGGNRVFHTNAQVIGNLGPDRTKVSRTCR